MLTFGEVADFYKPFVEGIRSSGFRRLNHGCFRTAFRRKNFVIKVPRNVDGVVDNMIEARAYKHFGNNPTSLGIYLAPCKLLTNNCLLMPFVAHLGSEDPLPEWAHLVDGSQVGMLHGRIVAYDYALDLKERYVWEKESILKSEHFQNDWQHVKPYLFPAEAFPPDEEGCKTNELFDQAILAKRFQINV